MNTLDKKTENFVQKCTPFDKTLYVGELVFNPDSNSRVAFKNRKYGLLLNVNGISKSFYKDKLTPIYNNDETIKYYKSITVRLVEVHSQPICVAYKEKVNTYTFENKDTLPEELKPFFKFYSSDGELLTGPFIY